MPTRERVQAFVAKVEAGDYVEAIRQFYTEDATMQENLGKYVPGARRSPRPRRRFSRSSKSPHVQPRPSRSTATACVNWVFDIVQPDGQKFTLDELAYQPGAAIALRRSGSIMIRRSAGLMIRHARKCTTRPHLHRGNFALRPADHFIAFFNVRVRTFARAIKRDHKPDPSLGLVSGFVNPAGAGRSAVSCSADRRCESSRRAPGMSPDDRFDSGRFTNARIAQLGRADDV